MRIFWVVVTALVLAAAGISFFQSKPTKAPVAPASGGEGTATPAAASPVAASPVKDAPGRETAAPSGADSGAKPLEVKVLPPEPVKETPPHVALSEATTPAVVPVTPPDSKTADGAGTGSQAAPREPASTDGASGQAPAAEETPADAAKNAEAKEEKPTEASPSTKPDASKQPDASKPEDAVKDGTNAAAPAVEVPAQTAPATPAATPSAQGTAPAPAAAKDAASEADQTPIPAKIETLGDGSMKVDGRFVVKGEGTAEKPYEVTWDQLVSVSELYNPRDGKKRLPERVTMFDGKIVRVKGYIAFPLYVEKPRELLSMLNQWDGCCIGVPPTPFDAIEVKLREPVEGGDRYATTGELTGKFGVKPYLAGDWLVGLYVMDDAVLTTKSTAGSTRN